MASIPAPSNELIHPNQLLLPCDVPRDIETMERIAKLMAGAGVGIPPEFRGDPSAVFALMWRAKALDIPLMVAMDNLVFDRRGTCAMRARLMMALVTVRAGHTLVPVETTDKKAVVRLEYGDGRKPFTAEWTIATAVMAGLVKDKSPWANYAANMLYWRAMAKAVAMGCPEATLGIGIIEAMDPDDPEDEEPRPAPIPEDVIVTDEAGNRIPDGSVKEILTGISYPEPVTGRPLITPETTIEDLREAWNRANRQPEDGTTRPLKRFAYHDGSAEFTVEQIIGDLVEQVTRRDAAKAAEATEDDTNDAPQAGLTAPAGTGVLPCGCDAATVAATGTHTTECTR